MAREKRNPLPKIDYLERVDDERRAQLDVFAEKVGVKIKDYNLINRGLSHKSYTNELGYSHNEQYEKLEFFGDGVLGLIVNEYLFKVFPESEEGELAKIKSAVVSEVMLAEVAREIELGEMILIGRGERRSGGTERPSLLADILEAFIGAVYMDQGLPAARRFVIRYIESSIRNTSEDKSVGDHKSYLQETIQKERGVRPVYSVMRSSGPDHSRIFRVAVSIDGRKWGTGTGKSKKEAEQSAAENALTEWEKAEPDEKQKGSRGGSRGGLRRGSRRDHPSARRERSGARQTERTAADGSEALVNDGAETGATDSGADATGQDAPDRQRDGKSDQGGKGRRGRRGGRGRSGGRGGRSGRGGREEEISPSAKNEPSPREEPAPKPRRSRGTRATTRGGSKRGGGRIEDVIPPKEIVDPIAWAAGESYVPRTRRVN